MKMIEKNTPLVVAIDLSKNYAAVKALSEVTFSLDSGIWGLIGPNGVGKTTLLNLIWGIIHPSSGSLSVLGFDPTQDDIRLKKQLGVCFTSQGFSYGYSCKDYLRMVASAYDIPSTSINSLVFCLLEALELDSATNRDTRELSSGMKQKLAIAQCLIGLPHLAILDEPFANLDPYAKVYVRDLFLQFHNTFETNFLISSHSLEDLSAFCTNYLFIDRGNILWKGSSKEVPKDDLLDFYMRITATTSHFMPR
ncbi:MAG: ABC transporter ATP-binding protein [Candidatus Hodarchaeales archaeon]|jgi:ABC-2 type transport system ATP-binding protein